MTRITSSQKSALTIIFFLAAVLSFFLFLHGGFTNSKKEALSGVLLFFTLLLLFFDFRIMKNEPYFLRVLTSALKISLSFIITATCASLLVIAVWQRWAIAIIVGYILMLLVTKIKKTLGNI